MSKILVFYAFVALSHGIFLLKAQKSLWRVHSFWNGLLWVILTIWVIRIQLESGTYNFSPQIRVLGGLFILFGFYFGSTSFRLLGVKGAMGIRFFFPVIVKRVSIGLYKYIQNPTYDGVILTFLGLWLLLGIKIDLYLAIESLILLNYFLGSIENYRRTLNPL